jgi:hypothetical protein
MDANLAMQIIAAKDSEPLRNYLDFWAGHAWATRYCKARRIMPVVFYAIAQTDCERDIKDIIEDPTHAEIEAMKEVVIRLRATQHIAVPNAVKNWLAYVESNRLKQAKQLFSDL